MPESERPEREKEIAAAFDRLTSAVEQVLAEYASIRERAQSLETEYESLREAIAGSGGADAPGDLDERLSRMAEENRRLRETLVEARDRAARLRSRLAVVEDEV